MPLRTARENRERGRNREFGERMEHSGREKRNVGEHGGLWESTEDCGTAQRIVEKGITEKKILWER